MTDVRDDQYYILATSDRADEHTRVLKSGDTFGLFDRYGNIRPVGLREQGIYHRGTRHVSRLVLRMGKFQPLILSSTVLENNSLLAVNLSNPDVADEVVCIPRGTVHVSRSRLLWDATCYERLRIQNFGQEPVTLEFIFEYDSDFADIFEVRGNRRERRGSRLPTRVTDGEVVLAYRGLDGIVRETRLNFSPQPSQVTDKEIRFHVHLEPKGERNIDLSLACGLEESRPAVVSYDTAAHRLERSIDDAAETDCQIRTNNGLFNAWIARSIADLRMMTTQTPSGPYPYAGVPWYSCPFGRDGIITALQSLWWKPELARGVLQFLASTQADHMDPEADAEPGKIVHEIRSGEMAALKEIPFAQYYGSVDSTPLFVMLAGKYFEATGDRDLIQHLWPNIERAIEWMDKYGDRDEDGFVEYAQRSTHGLGNQGWKDSFDAVFHADGRLAEGAIALCEVQGYVYSARRNAARLARMLGKFEAAERLERQAHDLQDRFERVFWCDDLSMYALALDGKKQLCRVRSSNAGQCLFTGIASIDRATRMAQAFFTPEFFSGWGIRTIGAFETRFNPMSYHNGSLWPHDNALIAMGFSRYGLKWHCLKIFQALFEASTYVDLHRMPELFCGFVRRANEGPTLYPVACSPQSWAAGAVFMFLQGCLGMSSDATRKRLRFIRPVLPDFLDEVKITNLKLGSSVADLHVRRYPDGAGINVARRKGPLELIITK